MTAPSTVSPPAGAASLTAAATELIGPLAGSVQPQPLPWRDEAGFGVDEVLRRPLVLVRLLRDLERETVVVTPTIDGQAQTPLVFDEWSERGTQLIAHTPRTDADGFSAAFAGTIEVVHLVDGASAAVPPGELVAVELVEGLLGRLAAVVLAEKARIRRQARELRAMRCLRHARDDALDRMGHDVSVPRLADRISWDAAARTVTSQPLPGRRETDADFRSRLRLWRGLRLPTPAWADGSVNGPGGDTDPGSGWMSELGFTGRVRIDERANPLLLALRLVAPDDARATLLDAIRRTHLIWSGGSADGDAVHAARFASPKRTARIAAWRASLATLNLPDEQPVAPSLAAALHRLDTLQQRLGAHPFGVALHGQHDDGGSRYELGLGVALGAPSPDELAAAAQAAQKLGAAALAATDPAEDPHGAWLLRACGLRTAHALDDGSVYASTLSAGGLVVDALPSPDDATRLELSARIEAGDGSEVDGPLATVVAAMGAEELAATDAAELAGHAASTTTVDGLDDALAVLDLPRVDRASLLDDVRRRLTSVSSRDVIAVDLGATHTAEAIADPGRLAALVAAAARAGASSVLPLATASGTLALLFGIVDLPLAGNNLAAQHTIAFRWQVRALAGDGPRLSPRRGPAVMLPQPDHGATGVAVVACLAYVRVGANDPHQWRPTLPPGVLLDLGQYEHLMNIVEYVTPVGVQANTWDIRRRHVDVDGSGTPTPLPPSAARTYHRYRTR